MQISSHALVCVVREAVFSLAVESSLHNCKVSENLGMAVIAASNIEYNNQHRQLQ